MPPPHFVLGFLLTTCATVCLTTWGCSDSAGEQEVSTDDGGADAPLPKKHVAPTDAGPDTAVPNVTRCTTPRGQDAGALDDAGPSLLPDGGPSFFVTHPLPQVSNRGGPLLANPHVVPIFFADDPLAADIEAFTSSVGCTDYWRAAVGEYGVGDAIAGPAVHLSEHAPSALGDTDIEAWLSRTITMKNSPLEAPTKDTVYMVFYPQETTITQGGGKSCREFGGYHTDIRLPSGQLVAYAAIPRCGTLEGTTGAASHELAEAATDPFNKEKPAFADMDVAHFVWTYALGGETADLCVQERDAFFQPDGYPFFVQRNWSNRAARVGDNPCVPKSAQPYFTAAPKLPDMVNIVFGQPTGGVLVPAGTSRTIDLDLYSEDANADVSVEIADISERIGGSGSTTYTLDSATGHGGDTLHLTLTAGPALPGLPGAVAIDLFAVYARVGDGQRLASIGAVGH